MNLEPSPAQQELIAFARGLALERFAPRAERHDREASFPFDDYDDLRADGLLGLCVPERYGGLGADYETYCLVAEQLAQGNALHGAHVQHALPDHADDGRARRRHADVGGRARATRAASRARSSARSSSVVSSTASPTASRSSRGRRTPRSRMGGRRFGTTARKVDGGYVVNGRKFFVSLAGSRAVLRDAGDPARRRAVDRAHPLSADPQGRAGCQLPGRVGPDGDARHRQPRHAAAGRVRPRRRPRCCRPGSSAPCTTPSPISRR